MRAINLYQAGRGGRVGFVEAPTLFFEFQGSSAGVTEQAEAVKQLATEAGGSEFQ